MEPNGYKGAKIHFLMLDRGIDDMENGQELPLEEAFQEINKLRNIKRNTRKR